MCPRYARSRWLLVVAGVWLAAVGVQAAEESTRDGPPYGSGAPLPLSDFLTPGARAALAERQALENEMFSRRDLGDMNAAIESSAGRTLDRWLAIYPSKIEERDIDGVRVYVVTPRAGIAPRNAGRVLISAHQGGFIFGGRNSALLEAVPLAGRGQIQVIAVDYRKAPQHVFPAASEDMEAVYREVLRKTRPANVGLYGCSAGGTLVAQSVARFQARGLPRPGAVSIMCSGALGTFWFGGESNALNGVFTGRPALKPVLGQYFKGVDMGDPQVAPAAHPEVLARFPPTLLVSGTRDIALSNVLMTHAALLEAGADARLFVQEGLGHGHFYAFPGTHESTVAYDVIWRFFDSQLGR